MASLPTEILLDVLQCLANDDKAALFAAVQVSRTWYACGIGLLWRDAPGRALLCVEPRRRQIFANYMTCLVHMPPLLPPSDAVDAAAEQHLLFPCLRELSVSDGAADKVSAMLRYLHPQLQVLSIGCDTARTEQLNRLPPLPHALHKLSLISRDERLVHWMLRSSLPVLTVLRVQGLLFGRDAALLDRAFNFFAQLECLQRLIFVRHRPAIPLRTIAHASSALVQIGGGDGRGYGGSWQRRAQAFRRLQTLVSGVESAAVAPLAAMLPCITKLTLVTDAPRLALPAVGRLTHMRWLIVTFPAAADMSRHDLLALQQLTQLRKLCLMGGSARDVRDKDFAQLLPRFAELCFLDIAMTMTPSAQRLALVGQACRQLKSLRIPGSYDMAVTANESSICPLFPVLIRLSVDGLEP